MEKIMNQYLSRKIKFLSFFAIVGVVYCHAYNYYNRFLQPTTILAEGPTPGAMLQFFISNGLVRFGVPLFFTFSGYLFFLSFDGTLKGYLQKVIKRIRTLLIPFFIWTGLAGGFLYIVYLNVGLERYRIVYEQISALKESGIGIWLVNSPAFQLWYVSTLFQLVLISPLIYLLVKKCKIVPVVIFGILWALELSLLINCEGLLFFTLGAYFAVNKVSISGMAPLCEDASYRTRYKSITLLFTALWIIGCFCYSLISGAFGYIPYVPYILWVLYKVNIITGLISVWRLYDISHKTLPEKKWMQTAMSSTMFVYVAHEPLLHLLTDISLEQMTFNGAHTLTYFMLSFGLIFLCVVFGSLLKKLCPRVYSLLTGGR